MKSLLYIDWCAMRAGAKQYLLSAAVICGFMVFGMVSSQVEAQELASEIHTVLLTTSVSMLSFFCFMALFGNDEREGWETVRLSLPVTRGHVVAARYASLVLANLALLVLCNLGCVVAEAIVTSITAGRAAVAPVGEMALASVVALIGYLLYLAIETPIFFAKGLSKARAYFTMPFLALLLLQVEAVSSAVSGVLGSVAAVADRMGSPLLLALVVLAVAGAAYGASLLLAQRLYARRDL